MILSKTNLVLFKHKISDTDACSQKNTNNVSIITCLVFISWKIPLSWYFPKTLNQNNAIAISYGTFSKIEGQNVSPCESLHFNQNWRERKKCEWFHSKNKNFRRKLLIMLSIYCDMDLVKLRGWELNYLLLEEILKSL